MDSPSTPSVSVVIVCRNDEAFIAETIESILAQNYPGLEVHVQDGGSTDCTLEILQRYPIRWKSEPDSGVPDGINRGIRATTGDVVIVLGGDDPMVPGQVQAVMDALEAHPHAGFVYGDIEYINAHSRPYYLVRGRPFNLDDMFWQNYVPTQSVAMRREAVVTSGMYPEDLHNSDWALFLSMGARYPSVYIPKVLGRYRVHEGSTTLRNPGRFARNIITAAERALQDPVVASHLRKGVPRARAGSYLTATTMFVLGKERRQAFRTYARALKDYPLALFSRRGVAATIALCAGARLYDRIRNRGRGPG